MIVHTYFHSFKGEFSVKWDSGLHFFELIQNNSLLIILFIIYLLEEYDRDTGSQFVSKFIYKGNIFDGDKSPDPQ